MSTNTKGIILIAIGKKGYGYAAYNLALSLKHYSPGVSIHLLHDGHATREINLNTTIRKEGVDTKLFDSKELLTPDTYTKQGRLDPAKIKVGLYEHLPFKHNLYLDVDALALQDITPFMESLVKSGAYYLTDVEGAASRGEKRNYSIWANDDDIWPFFGLDDDDIMPSIQSSYCYIKKGRPAQSFFKKLVKNYEKDFPLKKIAMRWGGTMPDELLFSVTLAQVGLIPTHSIRPIFRGWQFAKSSLSELQQMFYFLSIYGNGTGKTLTKLRYWEWYDKMLIVINRKYGMQHKYKTAYIKNDKHAN